MFNRRLVHKVSHANRDSRSSSSLRTASRRALCFAATISFSFTAAPRASAQGDFGFAKAKQLYEKNACEEALTVLRSGLEAAQAKEDTYYAFFLARDIAACHRRLNDVSAHQEAALLALEYLDELERSNSRQMSPLIRTHERLQLTGFVSKHYLYAHQLALAHRWHDRAGEALARLLELQGIMNYDMLSGEVPRRLAHRYRSEIPRHLWMGAWLLEIEARTGEALANLNAAERFLDQLPGAPNLFEKDYAYKVQNRKAIVLGFLGHSLEAIAIDRSAADDPLDEFHGSSILISQLNLYRNLSQYHGPSEEYLRGAIAAHRELEKRAPTGVDMDSRRQINKMIFDLRRNEDVTGNLEEIEAMLAASGFDITADYSERDQITIGIRLGNLSGLEDRLIALLERFRDQGNRQGVPTIYREYGNLLMKLDRPGDALFMYRQVFELSSGYGWHIHIPDILVKLAEAHLALGDTAAVEARLREIERHLANHPEIPAHRVAAAKADMVDLLRRLGRTAEGDALRASTLALAKKEGVPDYQIRGLLESAENEANVLAERPAATADDRAAIDFQPLRVNSEVYPGETAYARFTLANLSGFNLSGNLRFPAGIAVDSWDAASGALRLIAGGEPAAAEPFPIEVGPAELIRVFVESANVRNETPQDLAFEWLRTGFDTQTSHWTISATDSRSGLTVVNSNLVAMNPFYFVPLYHAVRSRDRDEPVRDFRVRCSVPCYVELIDEASETVIAIDRRGDGSFEEEGDIVIGDRNGNLFPDHRFEEGSPVFGLELRVFPTDLEALEDVDAVVIEVEGLVDGMWEVLAENRIAKE